MPKSREFPAEQPPIESESEESETEESDSEESDSEPEPEPAKKAPITPAPAIKKPLPQAAAPISLADVTSSTSSSSESDSGAEAESDSAPEGINLNVRPVISSAAAKAPASAAKAPAPASASAAKVPALATAKAAKSTVLATPSTGMKRPATPALVPDSNAKRSKKKAAAKTSAKKGASTEEGKKLFERVFTEEDEVVVLEELLKKYPNTKDPSEMDDFYNSVKSRVSVPVSKTQVQDKIRRLKNKYVKRVSSNKKEKKKKDGNNASEEEKRKEGLDLMAFELSKKIWGKNEEKSNGSLGTPAVAQKFEEAMKSAEVKEDEGMEEGKKERTAGSYARNGKSMEEWVFKEGTELLIGEEARDELEKEWKELRKEEAGILVKRFELLGKHARMVYEALNSKRD